jgi:hypothetical protein
MDVARPLHACCPHLAGQVGPFIAQGRRRVGLVAAGCEGVRPHHPVVLGREAGPVEQAARARFLRLVRQEVHGDAAGDFGVEAELELVPGGVM